MRLHRRVLVGLRAVLVVGATGCSGALGGGPGPDAGERPREAFLARHASQSPAPAPAPVLASEEPEPVGGYPADLDEVEGGIDVTRVCPAELAAQRTMLFGGQMAIVLPKGVELVEATPSFARSKSRHQVSTCEALVTFVGVGYFASDPSKPIDVVRDELVTKARAFSNPVTWTDERREANEYRGVYEVPESATGDWPVQGRALVRRHKDITVWVLFEAHPNAWNAIKLSLRAASEQLVRVAPPTVRSGKQP